ncbi:MAG TPA: type 4a pilus biogenesis protein PilO [Gemmatimonadaceae bacterium]|nr:type 4a pilus biogenesis protein PilO [Gemmatimonadaceae bacterium]
MALFRKERDKGMAAVIVIAAALGFAYHTYLFEPKNEELAQVQARITKLDQANASAKQELASGSVEELRAQAKLYTENLEMMRQLVPVGNEVPALLEQISTAARRVGLDVGIVEPQPVIPGDEFDTYRYKMGVAGNYHQIGEFLTNVGALTRIVEPIKLELKVANANARRGRELPGLAVLDAGFEIQTYVAKPTPQTAGGRR